MDYTFHKHMKKVERKERKLLNKKEHTLIKSKISPLSNKIQKKIPIKLKSTLEAAFYKSFQLVFEKGNAYIEKTYNKEKMQLEFDVNNYGIHNRLSKKYFKRLDKQAKNSKMLNSSFSVLEGGILGALGIGLPDIPFFISVIMRTIYQTALSYGYHYHTPEEKTYILLLICGAMTKGEAKKEWNKKIDELGKSIQENTPYHIDLEDQMAATSKVLSDALLTLKFIQGIPVVGAIGGMVNYNIINKIGKFATLKYKKRYLLEKKLKVERGK